MVLLRFTGLSSRFLQTKVPKLLVLAGINTLDVEPVATFLLACCWCYRHDAVPLLVPSPRCRALATICWCADMIEQHLMFLTKLALFWCRLTIGQMQGKFQLAVIQNVGHAVHEDAPKRVVGDVTVYPSSHLDNRAGNVAECWQGRFRSDRIWWGARAARRVLLTLRLKVS
jgi:hypothetical protein